MFRLLQIGEDLTAQRNQLIEDLSKKIRFLELDVTIVFDAQYQYGESTRSFFENVEILFTSQGETADEFIVEEIKEESNPHQVTVVTSDKKLAWFARRCSARTESVEEFVSWLNKRFKNKLRHQKNHKAEIQSPLVKEKTQVKKAPLPSAKPEECYDYYLLQFQERLQKIGFEKTPKLKLRPLEQENELKRKSKVQKDKTVSEMDRWLKLFENRSGETTDKDNDTEF